MSITAFLRRLALVELKANPPAPEERLPFVVIDEQTGSDIPGYAAHNEEMRALAKLSHVPVKEYTFDPAALFDKQPWMACTDEELLTRFRAIDENCIPKEYDDAPEVSDGKRLYRTWFRSDRAMVERAASRGPLHSPDRETIWQWIEAYAPGVVQ